MSPDDDNDADDDDDAAEFINGCIREIFESRNFRSLPFTDIVAAAFNSKIEFEMQMLKEKKRKEIKRLFNVKFYVMLYVMLDRYIV